MRKVDPQFISNTAGQPFTQGTWQHLQAAYTEALDAMAKSVIGPGYDPTKYYVLYGCKNIGTSTVPNITAGAIFFNGEIYLVSAFTATLTGSNVVVGNITQSFFSASNADPLPFTDGSTHNVHVINTIVFSQGLTGSGSVDYLNLMQTQLVLVNDQQGAMPSAYTVKFDQDRSTFFSSASVNSVFTFDFTNAIPGAVVLIQLKFSGAQTLGNKPPAGCVL
jgi:hypothetical protein